MWQSMLDKRSLLVTSGCLGIPIYFFIIFTNKRDGLGCLSTFAFRDNPFSVASPIGSFSLRYRDFFPAEFFDGRLAVGAADWHL